VQREPLLGPLIARAQVIRSLESPYPREGWARVTNRGQIYVHPKRLGEPQEWMYVLAHCVLHLGFGHFQRRLQQREWDLACDCVVWQFLSTLKLGFPPESLRGLPKIGDPELPARTEEALFRHFCANGIPRDLPPYSLTGTPFSDMIESPPLFQSGSSLTPPVAARSSGRRVGLTSLAVVSRRPLQKSSSVPAAPSAGPTGIERTLQGPNGLAGGSSAAILCSARLQRSLNCSKIPFCVAACRYPWPL